MMPGMASRDRFSRIIDEVTRFSQKKKFEKDFMRVFDFYFKKSEKDSSGKPQITEKEMASFAEWFTMDFLSPSGKSDWSLFMKNYCPQINQHMKILAAEKKEMVTEEMHRVIISHGHFKVVDANQVIHAMKKENDFV